MEKVSVGAAVALVVETMSVVATVAAVAPAVLGAAVETVWAGETPKSVAHAVVLSAETVWAIENPFPLAVAHSVVVGATIA